MSNLAPIGALALMATPVAAQSFDCAMVDGRRVSFVIDRNQFIDAVTPEEPIRRKVTIVQTAQGRFPAEPFLINDTYGFHGEGMGGASIMFVVQPDGAAKWANTTTGETLTGTCEGN